MLAYVFYSHYDYSDVWVPLFGQSEKFLKGKKKYLITNSTGDFDTKDWNVILYNDKYNYQKRVYESLNMIEEEYVIFHHEDMFLLGDPNFDEIDLMLEKIMSGQADLVKLIKASYDHQEHDRILNNLYLSPSNLSFAIQPTIIKTETLSNIYRATKGDSIWSFEANSNNYINFLNLKSCYYYDGTENKRGLYHWDSNIYPYIATAVVKGKWDFESYPDELLGILQEYNIDKNIRGTNE